MKKIIGLQLLAYFIISAQLTYAQSGIQVLDINNIRAAFHNKGDMF